MEAFLGIDVGSVSTNLAVLDGQGRLLARQYLRTAGRPIAAVQEGMRALEAELGGAVAIAGVGTTGSARHLTGLLVGADVIKNEITAHAVAALHVEPGVRTVLEIGGQDSKIIILRDGMVIDFAMNTVCAAGTGSFLDQQAARLGVPIQEFGGLALAARHPVRIAGRCTVFAESDMIHKQQLGHSLEDIVAGLCEALVRNYLNNVGKGKEILPPVLFQGGVAANRGLVEAFARHLALPVTVPPHHDVMGAIGAALLARDLRRPGAPTAFKGWRVKDLEFKTTSFECQGCPNLCEVVQFRQEGRVLARWGSRCGKWEADSSGI
ncbi:MAG: acyl-CoA dehydratase activase [Syntrophomonadaceae bacterium]|jgi:predicted CoA-substrate-specific enzyme activase|nr:acyl-CoA dehydratase activase [Syntrophomonadaceae bacterium]MDH7497360.1 acyl-CoA dehydratase activase [Syntrophomonadaceae bacterium]